jgi:hypothetical protein
LYLIPQTGYKYTKHKNITYDKKHRVHCKPSLTPGDGKYLSNKVNLYWTMGGARPLNARFERSDKHSTNVCVNTNARKYLWPFHDVP